MRKISRAGDTLWGVSAFDPKKPVDPNWASKRPEVILRSGDEERVLHGSPPEHDMVSDSMITGEPEEESVERPGPPDQDLIDMYRHRQSIIPYGGLLVGDDPSSMAQHNRDSDVSHYYRFDPSSDKPWSLVTTHPMLNAPMYSRHTTFRGAAMRSKYNGNELKRLGAG